ncbi:uncharacterized protein A4U43_C04F21260 [Asparagus officinalis]|uniref:Uncharacterized protein n=1 Tax=Asparagus officinalis TaxID=4686 RepID=A0A5P1F2M3_ASPOF|nr:uncharacterized protein A4U43_C04F21260 [Asparagus officinalis]
MQQSIPGTRGQLSAWSSKTPHSSADKLDTNVIPDWDCADHHCLPETTLGRALDSHSMAMITSRRRLKQCQLMRLLCFIKQLNMPCNLTRALLLSGSSSYSVFRGVSRNIYKVRNCQRVLSFTYDPYAPIAFR